MADYSFMWIIISWGLGIIITLGFLITYFEPIRRFITHEVTWVYLFHGFIVILILLFFRNEIWNFFILLLDYMLRHLFNIDIHGSQHLISNNLTPNGIISYNDKVIGDIERTNIAIFALFIPLMLGLYINYYKDIFSGLEKLNTLKNAELNRLIDKDQYLEIENKHNQSIGNFRYFFPWLRFLFYSNLLILIFLISISFFMYKFEEQNNKFIVLSFLKCCNSYNIITFIALLFSYVLLIIPIYKNLYDTYIFIKSPSIKK